MGCLRLLLENNPTNAAMFRECGGARCIHDIVPYSTSRTEALKIIRELILAGGNDDLGKIKIEKWISFFFYCISYSLMLVSDTCLNVGIDQPLMLSNDVTAPLL